MGGVLPSCGFMGDRSRSGVRLAYAQARNGKIMHIAQVPSGLACECICPGCGGALVARKGNVNEHHFGHGSIGECAHALESALHKLAKEVLHDRREILLPAVRADRHGRSLVTHPSEVHRFDEAILENRLNSIVPDVIVRKGSHRLLVEMFVTHRCGPEKIEKIRAMGLSCVEIDLSQLSRHATRAEVEEALLADAPRYWINNPKLGIAATRLDEQLEREREEKQRKTEAAKAKEERRLDQLAHGISRRRKAPRPARPRRPTETMRLVERHGFATETGQPVEGDACFCVSPEEWQSEVMKRFVIMPLERQVVNFYDFGAGDVLRHLMSHAMLTPEEQGSVSKEDEAALARRVPDYRAPTRVVESFLWHLQNEQIIASDHRDRWSITDETAEAWARRGARAKELERWRGDLRAVTEHILQKVEAAERGRFDLGAWWHRRHPRIGTSFSEGFRTDDHRLTQLAFALDRIEAMLFRNGEIVDDLCGLPLRGAINREAQARADKVEKERLEAEAAERRREDERVLTIASRARTGLGAASSAWLDTASAEIGTSPRSAAGASEAGLALARRVLDEHVAAIAYARAQEQLRSKLLTLAGHQRRPDHARVFLTSASREFRGCRPIDCCFDERSFEAVKKRMEEAGR